MARKPKKLKKKSQRVNPELWPTPKPIKVKLPETQGGKRKGPSQREKNLEALGPVKLYKSPDLQEE